MPIYQCKGSTSGYSKISTKNVSGKPIISVPGTWSCKPLTK